MKFEVFFSGKKISISQTYLFVCNRGDTEQYHGSLRSRELGPAPMLQVFLTPRQALSSHPRQQMSLAIKWMREKIPSCSNSALEMRKFQTKKLSQFTKQKLDRLKTVGLVEL